LSSQVDYMESQKNTSHSEFIEFISKLAELETKRSLVEYLQALWSLIQSHENEEPSFSLFEQLLSESFETNPTPFNESWLEFSRLPNPKTEIESFEFLRQTILCQIADLHRMKNMQISPVEKYSGFTLPTGNTWYNFDVSSFLECASAGLQGKRKANSSSIKCDWEDLAEVLALGQLYE